MFNQTQLAKKFGVSYEEMDRILIEYGLKSGEYATQKAIDCGYASYSTLPAPASGDFWFGMMAATHAFDGIPEAMRNDVHKRIDRELIGDRRPAFEKCGWLTFFRANGFCWRCLPDDTFKQQRLNYEVEAREAAAQLATSGWGTLHADNRLEPKDTDIELWNGAIDIAIDAFLMILADPSKCSSRLWRDAVEWYT